MSWETIAQLVILYGIPLTDKLITKWSSNEPPTVEAWNELKILANQSAKDRAINVLIKNRIDPTSEQGKELLALIG